ncbi:hypothetical protein DFH09DRAFT_1440960 [Mycena vulgaris]|nr:hypothetical protein DFH09DRAFT_1440960 [Mycena vulgaris]
MEDRDKKLNAGPKVFRPAAVNYVTFNGATSAQKRSPTTPDTASLPTESLVPKTLPPPFNTLKRPRDILYAPNTKRARTECTPLQRYLAHKSIALTEDQLSALHAAETQNVVIRGQPGSGKTVVAQAIAVANASADCLVLLLVRNRTWVDETKALLGGAKTHEYIDVLSPHRLLNRLFPGEDVHRDPETALERVRNNGVRAQSLRKAYSLIAIDESQDLTPSSFWLLQTLLAVVACMTDIKPRLILCGAS